MNILLINTNIVVSRLISLCVREEHINFEEISAVGAVKRDNYDLVFVDDASYLDETKEVLENLIVRKKVYLSSDEKEVNPLFDMTIKKPFLPSQIIDVIESLEADEEEEVIEDMPSIFPVLSEEPLGESSTKTDEKDSEILDVDEIEKIKQLLEMEEEVEEDEEELSDEAYEERKVEAIKQQLIENGLEIVNEEEIIEELDKDRDSEVLAIFDEPAEPKKKKEKRKKKKKFKKNREETLTFEESLLDALGEMKLKKIRKLLKGAEVSIKIRFKDEE